MLNIILGSLIIIVALYGGIYILDYIGLLNIPSGQYAASAVPVTEADKITREEIFSNPVEINWEGEVFGVLQSGNGYAIRNLDEKAKYPEFMAFWPEDKIEWLEGDVKITGLFNGIDCAYQNTVFGGNCVPMVAIKNIEKIAED